VASLWRTLEILIGTVPRIEVERSAPRRTRLAIATGKGDAHADPEALLALDRRIVEMADGDAADRILYLMQVFALRQSEARGLQVRDIADGLLVVQRQRLQSGDAAPLKTPWSRRRLPIAPEIWERLEGWSDGRDPEEWLVAEPVKTRLLLKRRNDRAQEVGFSGRIYSHDHRHIRASLALHSGVDEARLAAGMGHKDTQQVRETYGELLGSIVGAEVFKR
jgi:integrase